MVDNIPIIEYNHYIVLTELPKELFWTGSIPEWCPTCFNTETLNPKLALLDSYLSLLQSVYLSDSYTKIGEIRAVIPGIQIPFGGPQPVGMKNQFVRTIDRKSYNHFIDLYGSLRKMFGPTHVLYK